MGFLGILMLDTRFPRLPGDVGHEVTWRVPVRRLIVRGASPRRVVNEADATLVQPFIDAARALEADGATAITTSCGFLVRWQAVLQAAVRVPVWTSSLLALPTLARAGVITVDAGALGPAELVAAGASPDTPVEGLASGCHLQRTLLEDRPELDPALAEQDAVAAALRLVRRAPALAHLVLECTNLPPYAEAIASATRRPVHHLVSFVHGQLAAHGLLLEPSR